MVKLIDEVIKTKEELDSVLNENHIDFSKWYDWDGIDSYEERENILLMAKSSKDIWVSPADSPVIEYIMLDKAFEIYKAFVKKCKPKNGYDIIIIENDSNWIEDNEEN